MFELGWTNSSHPREPAVAFHHLRAKPSADARDPSAAMLESQMHGRGAAACYGRIGLSRHRSGDLRRPRAAKLRFRTAFSTQAASTLQIAPRRAQRRSPRAHDPRPRCPRPRRPEKERACLFNVAQAPFCCLTLPGGQRGLLRREDGYDGRPPRSVNVVGDCVSDLGAPEAILPLAAAG